MKRHLVIAAIAAAWLTAAAGSGYLLAATPPARADAVIVADTTSAGAHAAGKGRDNAAELWPHLVANRWAVAAAAAGLLLYMVGHGVIWPWRRCLRCKGSGKKYPLIRPRNVWRECGCCDGSGEHLRIAARTVRAVTGRGG